MTIPIDFRITVRGPDSLSLPPAREILQAADSGVRAALDNHFFARQREPRRDGLPQQGFWVAVNGNSVRERIRPTVFYPSSATIEIDSAPLAHKVNPNPPPIFPGQGRKFLTIPVSEAALRTPAPSMQNLRRKGFELVDSSTGKPHFILAKKARTPHDPRALPPLRDLEVAAASAVLAILR